MFGLSKKRIFARAQKPQVSLSLHDRFFAAVQWRNKPLKNVIREENRALDSAYTDLLNLFDQFYIGVRAIVAEDVVESCKKYPEKFTSVKLSYSRLEKALRRKKIRLDFINYKHSLLYNTPQYQKLIRKRGYVAPLNARPIKEISADIGALVSAFESDVSKWYEQSVKELSFFEKYQEYPHQYEENLFRIQLALLSLSKRIATLAVEEPLDGVLHDNKLYQGHFLNALAHWVEVATLKSDHVPDLKSQKRVFGRGRTRRDNRVASFLREHADIPQDNGYLSIKELRQTIIELGGKEQLPDCNELVPARDLVVIINELLADSAQKGGSCVQGKDDGGQNYDGCSLSL